MNRSFFHKRVLPLILVLLTVSCQKVIVIPINDEESKIVFEGVLKDRDSSSFFYLSRTVGIYEDESDIQPVSGAQITVFDSQGSQHVFAEHPQEPGTYVNYSFLAQENTTYNMTCVVGNEVITSTSFTKTKPVIDSIYTKANILDVEAPFSQWVYYHSSDPVDEVNNYRLRITNNGKEPSQYYIGNDYWINGETYEAQFFGVDVFPGDTIHVEMLEFDPAVYNYLYGLSSTLTTGAFSPAPSNPPSNLEGNAIGYFAVYMTDTASIIVQ
ncbi:MAG: DUF4249 domain-containing protein [Crocinitomicaceae bacterium]|nr:DUF4249 domain-containing protein [Crocinitomicaceae bacterium]